MELTELEITAVSSETVLARVVVLIVARGGRIRELRCSDEPGGRTRIRCLVETATGRGDRLAATVGRAVDVTGVEVTGVRSARLSALA